MDTKATIKSITADKVIIAGYGVVFGGQDLAGETFSADTDFMLDLVPNKLTLYDHGMNDAIKTRVIGRVPSTSITADAFGLWIEAELERSNEYIAHIMALAEKGILGWSSGSVSHLIQRVGKEIKSWPIVEFSLTPTPAEPRTLGAEVMKSLAEFDATLKSLLQVDTGNQPVDIQPVGEEEEAVQPEGARSASASVTESTKGTETETVTETLGESHMENETQTADLSPILSKLGEISDAFKTLAGRVESIEKQPATQPGFQIETPNLNLKTARGETEFSAYKHWLKTGDGIKASNATDMNVGTAADGGYAVPTGHYNGIIARLDESALYKKIGVMDIPGKGTTVNVPVDNEADGEFVSTAEAATFDLDAPAINQVAMTKVKYTKRVVMSYELLDDEDSKLMTFLDDFVGRGMAKTHNQLLITEALANGTASLTLDNAASVTAAEIPELQYKQQAEYDDGSVFIMRRSVEGSLRLLTGNNWQFAPTPAGTLAGAPTLFGRPVYNSAYMGAGTTGTKSLLYGNFRFMGMRLSPDITVLRDPYSAAASGQIVLHYYFRTVYKVLQAEAIHYATQL